MNRKVSKTKEIEKSSGFRHINFHSAAIVLNFILKIMKNYRLAVDENGSPFVLNSKGSIDFGYITEEMNLSPAPIRVAEGDESYGLAHMVKNHSDQLSQCGFADVPAFVEYASEHFTTIKEGHTGSYLL